MNSSFFVPIRVARAMESVGFEQVSDHTTTWQEATDYLRDNRIDVWITTDCNVNEILGYTGHIHLLMSAILPNYFEVEMGSVEDNYDYYKVMEETIIKALTYLK